MARVQKMKKMMMPNPDQLSEQIVSMRDKIFIGQKTDLHNEVVEWAKSIEYVYGTQEGEDVSRPSIVGKPYRAKFKSMASFPEKLRGLKDFLMINQSIPDEEIHAAVVTVFPPPKAPSGYENTIEPALMLARDRFVYVANSDDMFHYVMQNPDKIKEMFGMHVPKNMMKEIPEHAERGNAYHFNQTSAVSLSIKFGDESSFRKTIRNGRGWMEKSFEKRVKGRYIIVIDLLMNPDAFKASIKDTIGYIGDIAEEEKGTVKGNFARQTLQKIKDDMVKDEEDAPELVQVADLSLASVVDQTISNEDGLSSIERLQAKILGEERVIEEV